MMPVVVCTSDDFQSVLTLHHLRLGSFFHGHHVMSVYHACALVLQSLDMRLHILGHHASLGDDDSLVSCACRGAKTATGIFRRHEQVVADIVAVESRLVDVENGAYEVGSLLVHRVYVEHHEPVLRVVAPHVPHRQIYEEVVVGLSPLQISLAAGDISHQFGSVAPYTVIRTHIHRRIESPPRPWVILWRVGGAMEEHVVHSGTEHQVEVGLHLAQRCAEMLCEPSECLARCVFLARHVSRRRSIFQHTEVTVVGAGISLVLAQSSYAEVGESESLNLGDIHRGIAVD